MVGHVSMECTMSVIANFINTARSGSAGSAASSRRYWLNPAADSDPAFMRAYLEFSGYAFGTKKPRVGLPSGGGEAAIVVAWALAGDAGLTVEEFDVKYRQLPGWVIPVEGQKHVVHKTSQETSKVVGKYLWLFLLSGVILDHPPREGDDQPRPFPGHHALRDKRQG